MFACLTQIKHTRSIIPLILCCVNLSSVIFIDIYYAELNNIIMTNPEYSGDSYDEIDKEFQALVERSRFIIDEPYELDSLDEAVQAIRESLTDHLITFADIDTNDDKQLNNTVDAITECIETDFERIDGIDYEDEIVVSGQSIVVLADSTAEEIAFDKFIPLSDDIRLRGTIDGIFLLEIPSLQDLSAIMSEEVDHEKGLSDTNPFGIVLRLVGSIVEDSGGNIVEMLPSTDIVAIPLNYPGVRMQKVIRQESI